MLITDELIAHAAASAPRAETDRRLPPDTAKALIAAGFARHFVPARHGGDQGTFTELTQAVAALGAADPATAWCASLMASLARMAAQLPEAGARALWETGPDTVVVGSLSPFGKAAPDGDGWRVGGRWPYISAVDHADWALLCATVEGGEPRVFAVPRAALTITDTWNSIGMRGTGSHTAAVHDLHSPAGFSFPRAALLTGGGPEDGAPCHTVPLEAVNGLSFAAPLLGAAEGALDQWTRYATTKARAATLRPGAPGPGIAALGQALARSAGETDAARLLLERCAAVADREGADITPAHTTRTLRDTALAVDILTGAVNRLLREGGTAGQSEDQPLQRHWRDINTSATHIALRFDAAADAYARPRLGITATA
ncbi:acyl-CoA dehydrogenase family protein [Streptomyces sp. enrichment culture]|uniref:acyl-CoA dehydrogenase family protein n=1 Tax=Streptomyces sp. enrichment culture TaxID=1795815 RepID=UPI003F57B4D4